MPKDGDTICNNSLEAFCSLSFEYDGVKYSFKEKQHLKKYIMEKEISGCGGGKALNDVIYHILSKRLIPKDNPIYERLIHFDVETLQYLHNHLKVLFLMHLGLVFDKFGLTIAALLRTREKR